MKMTCLLFLLLLTQSTSTLAQWVQMPGPLGGMVKAIAISRQSGEGTGYTLFAGGYNGVFGSTDDGTHWSQLPGAIQNKAITIITSSPCDDLSRDSLLFAASNDSLWMSTDQGASWRVAGNYFGNAQILSVLNVPSVIAAGIPHTYVGTSKRLFHSSDFGLHWNETAIALGDQHFDGLIAFIPPGGGVHVFAGTWSGVFVSTDMGSTWVLRSSGLGTDYIHSLATDGNALYASGDQGIYRSSDEGLSWKSMVQGPMGLNVGSNMSTGFPSIFCGTTTGVFVHDGSGVYGESLNEGMTGTTASGGFAGADDIMLAGTPKGVFVSTGGWGEWSQANGDLPGMNITALLRNHQTLGNFTGEKQFVATYGNGVYRSVNRGASWIPANSGLTELNVNTLVLDSLLYAATSGGGIFVSGDLGASWSKVSSGLPYTDIVCLATAGSHLLAGTLDQGVYRSTDGGETWNPSNSGLLSPRVYAVVHIGSDMVAATGGSGIFRSTDDGVHWTASNAGLDSTDVRALCECQSKLIAGTHGGGIYISSDRGNSWLSPASGPSNRNIASLAANGTRLFAGTEGGGLFASSDGGTHWVSIAADFSGHDVVAVSVFPEGSTTDVLACTFGGGMFRSTYRWSSWKEANHGLLLSDIADLIAIQRSDLQGRTDLFAAASGIVQHSTDIGETWTKVTSEATDATAASLESTRLVAGVTPVTLFAGCLSGKILRSTDGGTTWTVPVSNLPGVTGLAIDDIAVVPSHACASGFFVFATANSAGVFRSSDGGDNWQSVNTGLGSLGCGALGVIDSTLFVVNRRSNKVFKSTDLGSTWVAASAGINDVIYGRLAISGTDIFVSTYGGIVGSRNRGESWFTVNAGLPISPHIDQLASGRGCLFCAVRNEGVYVSANGGSHWSKCAPLLPGNGINRFTASFPVDGGSGGYLLAGTQGAGIWRRSLSEILPSLTYSTAMFSFPGIEVGDRRADTLVVVNNGATQLLISSITSSSDQFSVLPASASIDAGGTIRVTVLFQPTRAGFHSAVLMVAYNGATTPDTIAVQGLAVMPTRVKLSSITQTHGPVGASITLSGMNFDSHPDSNIVRFGGTRAIVTAASSTSLTVTVPEGSMVAPVLVTTHGYTTTSGQPFRTTFHSCGVIDTSTFAPMMLFSVGGHPADCAIADLDGDGKLDVVLANQDSNTVSVLRNITTSTAPGAIAFAPSLNFPAGLSPSTVAVGDIDGDGKLDIAAGFWILRNTSAPGTIMFDPPKNISKYLGYATSVALCDVDGDGMLDVVNGDFGLMVFQNRTRIGDTMAFAPDVQFPMGDITTAVAVGDFDNDGRPDIAATYPQKTCLSVFQNAGSPGTVVPGTFLPPVRYQLTINPGDAAYTEDVAVCDFDGDGKPDIATALLYASSFAILPNVSTGGTLGTGSFAQRAIYFTKDHPQRVGLGDFDGDGKVDVTMSQPGVLISVSPERLFEPEVSVYQNRTVAGIFSDSAFGTRVAMPTQIDPLRAIAGDLDGDGAPDLVVTSMMLGYPHGAATVYRNRMLDHYTIHAESDSGGAIVPAGGVSVLHGTDCRFTFSPRAGYKVDTILVDGLAIDSTAGFTFSKVVHEHRIRVTFRSASGVDEVAPSAYGLQQNFPNPFNPITTVNFQLPRESSVTLRLYDILGREVKVIVNEVRQPGNHRIIVDGSRLASGIYIYRLTAADPDGGARTRFTASKVMTLVK
jgi:hypothetical protein